MFDVGRDTTCVLEASWLCLLFTNPAAQTNIFLCRQKIRAFHRQTWLIYGTSLSSTWMDVVRKFWKSSSFKICFRRSILLLCIQSPDIWMKIPLLLTKNNQNVQQLNFTGKTKIFWAVIDCWWQIVSGIHEGVSEMFWNVHKVSKYSCVNTQDTRIWNMLGKS